MPSYKISSLNVLIQYAIKPVMSVQYVESERDATFRENNFHVQCVTCYQPRKVKAARSPTWRVWLLPKRQTCPYNNISLLIEKPVQIQLSCLHSQYLSRFHSVLLAPSFCLVYFLTYKSNKMKAFCRTFFFSSWPLHSGCVAMCCLPW